MKKLGEFIKNLVNKFGELSTKKIIFVSVIIALFFFILQSKTISLGEGAVYVLLLSVIGALWLFGTIAIKATAAIIAIVYMTAMYTDVVMTLYGNVVEPFLLTIGAVLLFLAISYNKYEYGLRSRPLWSTLFAFILIITKLTFIFYGVKFITAELLAGIVSIILLSLWIYFLKNSKKTKVNKPNVIEENSIDGFKFIYFHDEIDIESKKWIDKDPKKSNAYPYIYSKALEADENKEYLVLVSQAKPSGDYKVETISLSKARNIKYLIVETKENKDLKDALKEFVKKI